MIKIEMVAIDGWKAAIRGMRNPFNSWDKSDSGTCAEKLEFCENYVMCDMNHFCIGPNDLARMKSLVKAGTDHRKFLRMINVTMDITAPLYWWKEFDTYKVGTVRNSCSTMHKIAEKEFTLDDFSHEHLLDDIIDGFVIPTCTLAVIIEALNAARDLYLKTNDKQYWWQMIQLLPSSYNQKATVQLNYEVLLNMYHSRKNHKLDEWVDFCKTIKTLPYMEEFIDE